MTPTARLRSADFPWISFRIRGDFLGPPVGYLRGYGVLLGLRVYGPYDPFLVESRSAP